MQTRPVGRPKVSVPRKFPATAVLTAEEKAQVKKRAENRNVSVSDYLRELLLADLARSV